jgi:hypothetical protein
MSKMPFMQYYPDAWLRDTRRLTRGARATWADIIAYAWNEPERGVYERSFDAFCLEHALGRPEAEEVIGELVGVADVEFSNTEVRIICRRMVREETERKLNAKYQAVYRDKHQSKELIRKVSGESKRKKLEVRSQKLETSRTKDIPPVVPQELIPTSNAIAEDKPYAIPLPEEKPSDSLVLFYKVLQGAPYDFRPWDKSWGRWKLKATELLNIFGGQYAPAYQCLKTKGEELTVAGRTWNFNTIVDQAHLWRQQHGGEDHALVNRERFLRDVIEQRRTRKIEGLRKISTPGEVLRECGNSVNLPPSAKERGPHENGRGAGDDGRALATVQQRDLEGQEDREVQNGQSNPGPDYSSGDEPDFSGPDG